MHGGLDSNGKPVEAVYGQSVSLHTHTHTHLSSTCQQRTEDTRRAELQAKSSEIVLFCLQEIHKRVMALSFRDCHTKIRHVDAHATLNEGVVVQVMGELSNNMQPMRKFMQTFVLAPEVGGPAFISAAISPAHPLLLSFREPSQTNSTSTTTSFATRTRCLLTLTLSLQKVRDAQTPPVSTSFTFLAGLCRFQPPACFCSSRSNRKSFCSSAFERLAALEPKQLRVFVRNLR